MKTAVFLLLIMGLGSHVHANEKRTIYDFEYGIFSRGTENFEEGDRTISSDGELEKTTLIKAKLGTKFGVRYWLSRAGFIGEPHPASNLPCADHDQSQHWRIRR